MARYTTTRGNPETKLTVINTNFAGGANILYSDDLVQDNEFRYINNCDLENTGELRARRGFSRANALSEVIYHGVTTIADFPIITATASPVKEIMLFKVLQNDNNAWRVLSEYPTLAKYLIDYGAEENIIKLFIVAELSDGTVRYWRKKYTLPTTGLVVSTATGVLPCVNTRKNNLVNVVTGAQYGKLFFTGNDSGLIEFNTLDDTIKYVGDFTGKTNSAYKPNGIEVRKLGFNVLGDSPLSWIDNAGLTVESIQGVYLTTEDRIPLMTVPTGMKIQLNIIHTGSYHDFTIVFSEYETPLDATIVKNTTLSTSGITVYDVTFLTHPSTELQINIAFTEETVWLEDYIDYYKVGAYDASYKAVETLDVGSYNIVQIYDRLVYYKGNEIWFSDINNFAYVPNFNFILLPLDDNDEIVKIVFFRKNYLIFTKKKIMKLEGNFESTSLVVDMVNDDVGCVAPESIALVENEMFFISTRGLRSLKTDVFREGLENLRRFDEKIYPIVPFHKNAVGVVYKEQYLLFSNLRGVEKHIPVRGRSVKVPDVLRFYFRTGAYSMDNFGEYPRFIINADDGELYSLMTVDNVHGIYKFGLDYDDFGTKYDCDFETAGLSMGYPLHEKKIKMVVFKFDGDVSLLYVDVYGDGYLEGSEMLEPIESTDVLDLASAKFSLNKERLPSKCRNYAFRVKVRETGAFSLLSVGYVFKLGKVREA